MLWKHDYRISPDVPPLWEYWVGWGMGRNSMHADTTSPEYRNIQLRTQMWNWTQDQMYHTPRNDGIKLLTRARRMALAPAVALAGLIGWWAWKLGGGVAAVGATYLYCLDPNFLGHGALAKNDVASALMYFATAYALWKAGRELTWWNMIGVAVLTAASVGVKFSGLLLGPVLVIGLGMRALSGVPWTVLGRRLEGRGPRLAAAAAVWGVAGMVTYGGLWALYDFRFESGPDGLQLDRNFLEHRLKTIQTRVKLGREPTEAEIAAWKLPLLTRAVLWGESRRLLPQAWALGFMHTQIEDQGRRLAYALGENYLGARWYYFPLAALVKSPLATIAVFMMTMGVGVWGLRRGWPGTESARWAAAALGVPALIYGAATLTASINIGLRHAFPVYPFAFVAMGLAVSRIWSVRAGRVVIAVLGAGLCVETAAAYPNYIAFFNAPSEPHRLWLLSDSNFDWGQDLPLLAAWQRKHPALTLYYDCLHPDLPTAYGLTYTPMPGGRAPGPGVVAVGATNLQTSPLEGPEWWRRQGLEPNRKPDEVLGTTIYLFKTRGMGK
jgi:hypothetical protein